MKITVKNGYVMGTVSTNKVGSECEFCVCTVKDYEQMTEDEAYEALERAMWESGYCNVRF
jgi:hypothetical protein